MYVIMVYMYCVHKMQEALMVDCMCVWLYAHLGTKVMEKASTVLGSEFPCQYLGAIILYYTSILSICRPRTRYI